MAKTSKSSSTTNPESQKLKVLFVDDHPVLRQGMTLFINKEPDMNVCWEGGDGPQALQAIEEHHPHVAVVDLSLKGSDGIELTKNIKARFPKLPILVLSMHEENLYAERAIRAGAKGYIMKAEATQNLLTAIRQVCRGEVYLSDNMKEKMVYQAISGRPAFGSSPVERLTDRELEVFRLLGEGRGTREIAQTLRLSVKTVETYRAHIMDKLGLKKANELVMHAYHWVNHSVDASSQPPPEEGAAE